MLSFLYEGGIRLKKINWYDGSELVIKGDSCLNVKKGTKLVFPETKINGEVWLEAMDVEDIINHARCIKDKDSTIPLVCNSIWLDQDRISLFLQNEALFDKVVILPYKRGRALDERTFWECYHEILECLHTIPKHKLIIDLIMATTISASTKTVSSFASIARTLMFDGYQTLISLDNYRLHSKDLEKDENLQSLSEVLIENDLTYLLGLEG